jgi:hypothetical protein
MWGTRQTERCVSQPPGHLDYGKWMLGYAEGKSFLISAHTRKWSVKKSTLPTVLLYPLAPVNHLLCIRTWSSAETSSTLQATWCATVPHIATVSNWINLHGMVVQVLQEELQRIPPHLAHRNSSQLWSIVYLPQIGYVMQISGAALTGYCCAWD